MKVTITVDTDFVKILCSLPRAMQNGNVRVQLENVFSQAASWLSEPTRGPGDWSPLEVGNNIVGEVFIHENHPTNGSRSRSKV